MKTGTVLALAFAVITASFLRLYNIGFQCYWTEEEYTLQIIKEPILTIISHSIISDFNPPTFYLAALLSSWIYPVAEAIRYPSAICGILLIVVMYYLGKEIHSETTGLYSAGITVAIYPLVYYSQFGRSYSMLMLAFAIALLLYVRIKNGDWTNRTMILFAIASGTCLWMHLFAGIPVSLMVLDVLVTTRNKIPLVSAIIASPFAISFISIIQSRGTQTVNYGDTVFGLVWNTPIEFFGRIWVYLLVLAGFALYVRDIKFKKELLIITIVTITVGVACSFVTPVFPRYYATVSLIPIIFAAIPIAEFSDKAIPEKIAVVVFLLFVVGIVLIQYPDFLIHYTIQKYPC